jgi:hypothetical protein
MVEEIEKLISNPWTDSGPRLSLAERLRKSVALTAKLAALQDFGIAVFAGTYTALAQIPAFDVETGHLYTTNRSPFEPVTICRVTLDTRKKGRVVLRVTDKWEEPAPNKSDSDAQTDDCPF